MYSLLRDNISYVESHQSTGWKGYPFNANLFNGYPVDLIITFHIFLLDSLGSQTFNFHQAVCNIVTLPTVIALILIIKYICYSSHEIMNCFSYCGGKSFFYLKLWTYIYCLATIWQILQNDIIICGLIWVGVFLLFLNLNQFCFYLMTLY